MRRGEGSSNKDGGSMVALAALVCCVATTVVYHLFGKEAALIVAGSGCITSVVVMAHTLRYHAAQRLIIFIGVLAVVYGLSYTIGDIDGRVLARYYCFNAPRELKEECISGYLYSKYTNEIREGKLSGLKYEDQVAVFRKTQERATRRAYDEAEEMIITTISADNVNYWWFLKYPAHLGIGFLFSALFLGFHLDDIYAKMVVLGDARAKHGDKFESMLSFHASIRGELTGMVLSLFNGFGPIISVVSVGIYVYDIPTQGIMLLTIVGFCVGLVVNTGIIVYAYTADANRVANSLYEVSGMARVGCVVKPNIEKVDKGLFTVFCVINLALTLCLYISSATPRHLITVALALGGLLKEVVRVENRAEDAVARWAIYMGTVHLINWSVHSWAFLVLAVMIVSTDARNNFTRFYRREKTPDDVIANVVI